MIAITNMTAKQLVHVHNNLPDHSPLKSVQGEAIMALASALVRAHIVGCHDMNDLLQKYIDHGYRPSLRGPLDGEIRALATLYDAVAEGRGLKARALFTSN